MRKRYVLGTALTLLLVAVMAFGAIGSGAWFTADAEQQYSAKAGTMTMALSGTLQSPENMKPGDVIELGKLTLKNTGSLPYKLRFKMETTNGADGEKLAEELWITIKSDLLGGVSLPEINLDYFTGHWIGYQDMPILRLCQQAPSAEDDVEFTLRFASTAGDAVQGLSWEGTMYIEATQFENEAVGWNEFPW